MKKIFLSVAVACISLVCLGQMHGSGIAYGNWDFGFPVGNNFVTAFGGYGGNIGGAYFPKDNLAVGLELKWNNYYEYAPNKTYFSNDGAANTDVYKYIFALPILATVSHFFYKNNQILTPYVKLGLGAMYSQQNVYYNIYETTYDNWGFVAVPEIGAVVHFGVGSKIGLNTSVRYLFATNGNSYFHISNIQAVNFNVGLLAQVR